MINRTLTIVMQKLLRCILALCLVSATGSSYAQFTPGQILTAAQLNSALAAKLPLAGGTLTGPLTAPSLSVTGIATLPSVAITGGTITGLSAPVPVASGGTGAATQSAALAGLLGSSAVPIANGGTGATTTAAALTALGATPIISANATLNVPSQYSSIQAACDYLGTVTISKAVTVTIQVANGTYNWQNIECKIPQGDHVQILGNTTTPASVVINVNNASNGMGFQFYRGERINLIDGFTINGTAGWTSHCNWNANTYGAAFDGYGTGSGAQIGAHVVVNKMYYGVLSDQGASFSAPNGGLTINEAGDAGVLTRWSGSVDIENSTSNNACDTTGGNNLGFGFLAEVGGAGRFDSGSASGNNVAGVAAQNGGAAWAHSMTLTNNTYGLYGNEGGNIEGNNSIITGGTNGVQSNNKAFVNAVGVTVSGASGSGMNAANSGVIDAGSGATANSNPNGFTQFTNGVIYGTMNGTSNTFSLFVNGNSLAGTTVTHSSQEVDASYAYSAPMTGATVTMTAGTETAVIAPAGTLAALTVALPACTSGYDGSIARYSSTQTITALTVNATSGTVSNAPTTLAAGAGHADLCRGSNTTWYPLY